MTSSEASRCLGSDLTCETVSFSSKNGNTGIFSGVGVGVIETDDNEMNEDVVISKVNDDSPISVVDVEICDVVTSILDDIVINSVVCTSVVVVIPIVTSDVVVGIIFEVVIVVITDV